MRHELDPPFSFYPHQRGKLDSQNYTLVFKEFYNWTLGFQESTTPSFSNKIPCKTIPSTLFTQAFKHTD